MPTTKPTGMSSYKAAGRSGYRYRKQINNRRYEKRFYGTKKERDEQYLAWRKELEEKQKSRNIDGSVTFDYFADQHMHYLRTVKDKTTGKNLYRPRTIEEYKYALARFKKTIRLRYMNDLTFKHVAAFRRVLRGEADAREENYYGVNKDVGAVIRAFEWGMPEAFVPVINFDIIKPLPTGSVVVTALQPWQMDLIVKYSSLKMRVAIKLGYYGGCRPEEVYNMLLSKIDHKRRLVMITENKEDKKLGIKAWEPKGGKERPVALEDDLLEDISRLNPKGPYLLTDKNDNPFTDKNFSNAFKTNLKHVNKMILSKENDTPVIQCTFKILRKTTVTQMVARGAETEDASLYADHADTQVTEEHYLEEEVRKQAEMKQKIKHVRKVRRFLPRLKT
jgi:integrase